MHVFHQEQLRTLGSYLTKKKVEDTDACQDGEHNTGWKMDNSRIYFVEKNRSFDYFCYLQ